MLIKLIAVIILQYIHLLNHHVVHLKLIHRYMSIISQLLIKERFSQNRRELNQEINIKKIVLSMVVV